MGAAASVTDREAVPRELAVQLAGEAWDEAEWALMTADAGSEAQQSEQTVPATVWNAKVEAYAERLARAGSKFATGLGEAAETGGGLTAGRGARRPGLSDRDLESEDWYFTVGKLMNPSVCESLGLHPVSSFPARLSGASLAFTPAAASAAAAQDAVLVPLEPLSSAPTSPAAAAAANPANGLSGAAGARATGRAHSDYEEKEDPDDEYDALGKTWTVG